MFDKLADFEREMFELQKNHRLNIRELMEEAEKKMVEMKQDHNREIETLVYNSVFLKRWFKAWFFILCTNSSRHSKYKTKLKKKISRLLSIVAKTLNFYQ